jgi:hypothetical protein
MVEPHSFGVWQPIETVDKTEDRLILWDPWRKHPAIGWWDENSGEWSGPISDFGGFPLFHEDHPPTYWLPWRIPRLEHQLVCVYCGEKFSGGRQAQYCSWSCQRKARYRRARARGLKG